MSELKDVKYELGKLVRADGSCFYAHGLTSVIVGVQGPVNLKASKQLPCSAIVQVHPYPATGTEFSPKLEQILTSIVSNTLMLRQYPRCAVDVSIQELENDGRLYPAIINATCLALLDCGISMKNVVAAVSLCLNEKGERILFPNDDVLLKSRASFLFAFENTSNNIICCDSLGSFTEQEFCSCMQYCRDVAKDIFVLYRTAILEKFGSSYDEDKVSQ